MKNVLYLLVGFGFGFGVAVVVYPFNNQKKMNTGLTQEDSSPKKNKDNSINKGSAIEKSVELDSRETTLDVIDPNAPAIVFEEELYDFGKIQQGDIVSHTFKFTNTGGSPLIITNAKAGCGCTVPKWPKEPIPPGQSSEIEVAFDSKGKKGQQKPSITITSNAIPNTKVIRISSDILLPEEPPQP